LKKLEVELTLEQMIQEEVVYGVLNRVDIKCAMTTIILQMAAIPLGVVNKKSLNNKYVQAFLFVFRY